MLPSQRNTCTVRTRVMQEAKRALGNRKSLEPVFEHEHWWVQDRLTGEQWDAVDTDKGFDFEQVTGPQD